jgi:hypothetical protein
MSALFSFKGGGGMLFPFSCKLPCRARGHEQLISNSERGLNRLLPKEIRSRQWLISEECRQTDLNQLRPKRPSINRLSRLWAQHSWKDTRGKYKDAPSLFARKFVYSLVSQSATVSTDIQIYYLFNNYSRNHIQNILQSYSFIYCNVIPSFTVNGFQIYRTSIYASSPVALLTTGPKSASKSKFLWKFL